jgi:hypothetical protein
MLIGASFEQHLLVETFGMLGSTVGEPAVGTSVEQHNFGSDMVFSLLLLSPEQQPRSLQEERTEAEIAVSDVSTNACTEGCSGKMSSLGVAPVRSDPQQLPPQAMMI